MARPEIRFKREDGSDFPEWKTTTIGEIVERQDFPVLVDKETMYREIGIRSHGKGLFHKEPVMGRELGNKRVFRIVPDCLVLNIVFAWERAVAKTTQNEVGMIASHRFPMYKPIEGTLDLDYIVRYMTSEKGKKILELASPGGAGRNRTLGQQAFINSELMLPCFEEQQAISSFLEKLDEVIAVARNEVEKYKKLKTGLMQKMFPRTGSKVPEIRFPGFSGDWEQRKLGEMVSFSKGSGYTKADLKSEGTPIILYGRLYTKYETVISEVDTFVNAKPGSVYSKGGEVIVPASGESAEDIAVAAVVEKSGVLLGGDLNVIQPPKYVDSAFLALSISCGKPHNDMARMAQGKSIVHLHNSDLEKIDFFYPEFDEQKKISDCFVSLDNIINLYKRELKAYEKLKEGFLQKMFI